LKYKVRKASEEKKHTKYSSGHHMDMLLAHDHFTSQTGIETTECGQRSGSRFVIGD